MHRVQNSILTSKSLLKAIGSRQLVSALSFKCISSLRFLTLIILKIVIKVQIVFTLRPIHLSSGVRSLRPIWICVIVRRVMVVYLIKLLQLFTFLLLIHLLKINLWFKLLIWVLRAFRWWLSWLSNVDWSNMCMLAQELLKSFNSLFYFVFSHLITVPNVMPKLSGHLL